MGAFALPSLGGSEPLILLRNTRKTEPVRPARSREFLGCLPPRNAAFALLCHLLLVLLGAPAEAASLRAGVARVDITPPPGHVMGGYAARKEKATGTHDPLLATVLVLESGPVSLALVTADLRSFVSTRVGDLAKQKYGIQQTILSVSHTHSGPVTWESPSKWYNEAEEKMVDAIGEAKKEMFPAEIDVAAGTVQIGFNRRKVTEGKAEMWWRNEERLPSHPVDPTVTAIRIRQQGGRVRAILVHYACHATVLGPDNAQYSADYPGALRQYVESFAPGALCLFLQGGAGDINPFQDKQPLARRGFPVAQEVGETLGRQALTALDKAQPLPLGDNPLQFHSEIVTVKNRWKPEEEIPIGITAGLLGKGICFLTVPGEPFVEHQMAFRQRSECSTGLLLGYSYSAGGMWAGYIPTLRAAVEGGYGANYNTTVEVGAGEFLVRRGAALILQLRGLLRDLPEGY